MDRTGNVLVSTDMGFSLEMYKTKVDDNMLNNSISLMTRILANNGDIYIDDFPISINPFEYHFSSDKKFNEFKEIWKAKRKNERKR